jgi:hypothetical protein
MAASLVTWNRAQRAKLVLAGLVTVGLVAWLSFRFLPRPGQSHLQAVVPRKANAPEIASLPSAPPDPATSMLGATSSLSPDELELVLVATSPGPSPREGTASLGTDPRNPQTYAVGAVLVNGSVIEEIHADHVLLAHGGKRFVLTVGGKTIGRRLANFVSSSDSAAVFVGGPKSINKPLDNLPSSREDLSEIIRPEPFYERDVFAGIRVLPGRNRSRLDALGLKSGDIIRTIDGKPMRSADAGWQELDDALSTATSIVVSIERDGSLMSIYLDGSRLSQDPVHMGATAPMPGSPGT